METGIQAMDLFAPEAQIITCDSVNTSVINVQSNAQSNALTDIILQSDSCSLTQLIQLYQQVEEQLIESGGVEELGDLLDRVDASIERKLDGCKGIIEYWEGQVDYLDQREKMFKERKGSIKSGIAWMKEKMRSALLLTGKEKVKTIEGTYYFVKPRTPAKVLPEYVTEKYAAALSKLGLRSYNVVITVQAKHGVDLVRLAEEMKTTLPDLKISYEVTEPKYDIEGIWARWSVGNRKKPAWLATNGKSFAIR